MDERERMLRSHAEPSDVLREYLRQRQPAYYRSCAVVRAPITLPRSFPNLLWPAYDRLGYTSAAADGGPEVRIEACGALSRLQTTTASLPYLAGVAAGWAAAFKHQPAWTDAAGGIESSDDVRELANTLQSLVDNYNEEA